MTSPTTRELYKLRNTVGLKSDKPDVSPRSRLVSRIAALLLRSMGVPELIHLYGALELNKTLTFDAGENGVRAYYSNGTHLYASVDTSPGKIIKINLSDLTKISTLTLSVPGNPFAIGAAGDYLYVGLHISPGKLVKIDLNSFTENSILDFALGENFIYSITSDGSSLYVGLNTQPGKIVKVDLASFTKVSTLTFAAGENSIYSMCLDSTAFLYATLYTTPGKIVKVDLSSFSKVSTLTLDTGENYARRVISDGSYIYIGLYLSPSRLVKIDIKTFTKVSTLTFETGENNIYTEVSNGSSVYIGLNTSPGKIVKVDLSSFSKVSTLTLDTGENIVYDLFTDSVYFYIGVLTTPGKAIRRYIIPTTSSFERKTNLIDEQTHSGTHHIYPTLASAVTITSSATAWTMGNYAEIVPINTIKTMFYITGVVINNMVIDTEYEVNIAIGLAAAEIIIGTFTHETNDTNLSCIIPIDPPIQVPIDTRISARCATENAAGDTCKIKIMYKD